MHRHKAPFAIQLSFYALLPLLALLIGCDHISTQKELDAFNELGPPREQISIDTIKLPDREKVPYQLVSGDLISVYMPDVMDAIDNKNHKHPLTYDKINDAVFCRVNAAGQISVPIIGNVSVKGKTVGDIEKYLADRYYPKYLRRRPSIVVKVEEYETEPVAVVGGVKNPGMYELRSDEMTLIAALGKAGGIIETGAENIQVFRQNQTAENALCVKIVHQTIPVDDPNLLPGDKVVVQSKDMPSFTVIGLVKKPGKYPYPPSETYSVMQALAHAGGLNEIAKPEYVKVYRKKDDGTTSSIVLKIDGEAAKEASGINIKPGDVVAIEQTMGTYTRLFLAQILNVGFSAGANVGP